MCDVYFTAALMTANVWELSKHVLMVNNLPLNMWCPEARIYRIILWYVFQNVGLWQTLS